MAQPILNWVGGKREELVLIRLCFPEQYGSYHELFFGGGAVFFDTAPHQNGSTINDINERLINLYQVIKDSASYKNLINTLENIIRDPNAPPDENLRFDEVGRDGNEISSYYYQQRELFNNRVYGDEFDSVKEAARLIYLNKTCFNAVYRENNDGAFNVPVGDGTTNNWGLVKERIEAAHELFSNIDITRKDYREIASPEGIGERISEGDLVYLDPPYQGTYNQYHATQFDYEQQIELRDTASTLAEEGVDVIISNSMDMAYDYCYNDQFNIVPVGKRRLVNADATNRDQQIDIIITNVDVPDEITYTPEEIHNTEIEEILDTQRRIAESNSASATDTMIFD